MAVNNGWKDMIGYQMELVALLDVKVNYCVCLSIQSYHKMLIYSLFRNKIKLAFEH